MKNPPVHQIDLLNKFRFTHPRHQMKFEDWSWQYICTGSGEQTLLLLPGAFIGAEMWLHLITTLEDRYRILAPDMPSKSLTLAEMHAAFIKLLDSEKIDRVILIGYSAGSGLAQAFAQTHPERVEALILSHCTPLNVETSHRVERLIRIMKLLPVHLIRAMFRRRSKDYPPNSEWADFTRAFFAEKIASLNKADLIRFFQSGVEAARAFHFDPQGWHGKTLLLSSKDDKTTFKRLEEMQTRYPAAQTYVFEQGGHHTLLLFPEIYNLTLTGLLEE